MDLLVGSAQGSGQTVSYVFIGTFAFVFSKWCVVVP